MRGIESLAQVLPATEAGTSLQMFIKYLNSKAADPRFMFISLLLLALGTISAAVVAPTFIEAATRKQCLNRDWPLDQTQAHIEFCHSNGYDVGKLGPAEYFVPAK